MAILLAPTANFVSTTLNGNITDVAGTITLNSTANLQAPGVVVIDRIDINNLSTPTLREVVSFTGIAGNDLTGCARGADNSTARNHSDGAVVETNPTVGAWNSMVTAISQFADSNGYLRPLASPASIAILQNTTFLNTSIASIGELHVKTFIDLSSASVAGISLYPVWRGSGAYSGPTTVIGGLLNTPKIGTWSWFSVMTRTVASGASVVFDVMKNGSSIFAGVTKPTIVGGGTFVSTASINTKNFAPGNTFRSDINAIASGAGVVTDVTIQGGSL